MKWIKKNIISILLVLVCLAGLCLMLYPTVSDYWNSFHQSRAIAEYTETVADMDEEEIQKIWDNAIAYNEKLAEGQNQDEIEYNLSDEALEDYESQLDISNLGIMGYIDIPKINCSLPIYHGTDEAVLQIAAGHIEWTSLPVGGKSTHSVISGHRGLPSAKLFSDLDKLEVGDVFTLSVLNETLTYEVDQIRIVLPEETDDLKIVPGQDLCTLVTCTPYGINSHRLLVRGHRIKNQALSIVVTSDALPVDKLVTALAIGIPLLLILWIVMMAAGEKRRKHSCLYERELRRVRRARKNIEEPNEKEP